MSSTMPANSRQVDHGGYRDHDLGGFRLAQRLHRRQHAGPGGDPSSTRMTVLPVTSSGAGRRGRLPPGAPVPAPRVRRSPQLLRADAQTAQHVVVDHHPSAAGQRAHREFLVSGRPRAADDERVERHAQRLGDLVGDRDAAASQPENHHVGPAAVGSSRPGQDLTGLPAILDTRRVVGAVCRWWVSSHRPSKSGVHPVGGQGNRCRQAQSDHSGIDTGRDRSPVDAGPFVRTTGSGDHRPYMQRGAGGGTLAACGRTWRVRRWPALGCTRRGVSTGTGDDQRRVRNTASGDELVGGPAVQTTEGSGSTPRVRSGPGWCRWARTAAGSTATSRWRT